MMEKGRVIFGAGMIWLRYTMSESGVRWFLYYSYVHDTVLAGIATLERWHPVAKQRPSKNGTLSFAEQLLARQKAMKGRETEAYDEDWCNASPTVHELLTRVLRDDKKVFEPASLVIYARAGSWHAMVSHKSLNLKWWGEGPTIREAVAKLERSCLAEMGQEASEGSGANTGQP